MQTKHIYGFDYQVVNTNKAVQALIKHCAFHEVDEANNQPSSEQIWWQVAIINRDAVLWMNNQDGEILILTGGPESYYRIF